MKTWTQLLGVVTMSCMVSGKDIVMALGNNAYRRLWSFDTNEQAKLVFAAWREELRLAGKFQ